MSVESDNGLGMRVGARYIVTRKSEDGEFQPGDHVWLEEDGAIVCREARGWMPPEDVPAATRGMAVEIDAEWIEKRRARIERQLSELDRL